MKRAEPAGDGPLPAKGVSRAKATSSKPSAAVDKPIADFLDLLARLMARQHLRQMAAAHEPLNEAKPTACPAKNTTC